MIIRKIAVIVLTIIATIMYYLLDQKHKKCLIALRDAKKDAAPAPSQPATPPGTEKKPITEKIDHVTARKGKYALMQL